MAKKKTEPQAEPNEAAQDQQPEQQPAAEPKAEKPKKEPKVVPPKDERNGVSRPATGATFRVWQVADEMSAELKEPVGRAALTEKLVAEGLNIGTIHTQFGRWRKYYGLVTPKEVRAEQLAKARAEKEVAKAEKAKAKAEAAEAKAKAQAEKKAAAEAQGGDPEPAANPADEQPEG